MRKSFLTTRGVLGSAAALCAGDVAAAGRMRRAFSVLLLIASIGCSEPSPVAPSPVAEVGATSTDLAGSFEPTASGSTSTNVAGALEPTTSGPAFTNVAVASEAPVRGATHRTSHWTFEFLNNTGSRPHANRYRGVEFISSPETGDQGTHWYVQFRSIETYNGQPHERGVFIEARQGARDNIFGFWANARYVVRVRSYAQTPNGHYYSIGQNLIEVGRFTTRSCPSGTQHRDSDPNPENPYRCERIPQPPAPVVSDPLPPGMITVDAANAWKTANSLSSFAVASRRNFQGTSYANIFIFHGGSTCPATYTFRRGRYTKTSESGAYRNGCAHQSVL